MAYGESNDHGHVTDDVTWSREVKSWFQYAYSMSRKQPEI